MPSRLPPLDTLPFFDAAMRSTSFAAAAAELHVTPSAVSQRIKALEQALGVTLFERLPHGLRPTEAGRLYLLEVRPALGRLRSASARVSVEATRRPAGRERRLAVDMLPALATTRFAFAMRRFAENFPGVELRLSTSFGMTDPARDGFDCCVRYGPGGWPGVVAEHLADEKIFIVCSPALLTGRTPVTDLADIVGLPTVNDMMPIGWTEWRAAFGGSEKPTAGPTFSDSALAQRAAVEGLGVALGRSLLVAPDLAAGRLVRLLPHEIPSPFAYWLVRPPGRADMLVDLFRNWLMEEVVTDGVTGGYAP
jgi:LysR family transcriptional regulator, glycine cleavage system transcriptional activator